MIVAGIDPGVTGGLAIIEWVEGRASLQLATPTPVVKVRRGKAGQRREYDLATMGALVSFELQPARVAAIAIEAQRARPGQGVVSMFSIGYGMGLWRGMLAVGAPPVYVIEPAVWKRHHQLLHTSKAASTLRAHERIADAHDMHHEGCAEAALMALYLVHKMGLEDVHAHEPDVTRDTVRCAACRKTRSTGGNHA